MTDDIDLDNPIDHFIDWTRSPAAREFRPEILDCVSNLVAELSGACWTATDYALVTRAVQTAVDSAQVRTKKI